MDFLESIFDVTGFNALLEHDFRSFILKTFLFSALLAGPFTVLSMLFRFAYHRFYFSFIKDRRNKKGGEYHE